MLSSTLLSLFLLSLWVAAWLHWIFASEVRQFVFVNFFPEKWRSGLTKEEVQLQDDEDFTMFLSNSSAAPAFINGVMACPSCMSAHVSWVGCLLFFIPLGLSPWLAALVWAGAAWIGNRLNQYL